MELPLGKGGWNPRLSLLALGEERAEADLVGTFGLGLVEKDDGELDSSLERPIGWMGLMVDESRVVRKEKKKRKTTNPFYLTQTAH